MRFAVCIVAPRGYPHSAAFLEVAETLFAGLRQLGHEARLSTDLAVPGYRSIVLGSNLLAHPAAAGLQAALPTDAVLYNLEQVDEASGWMSPALLDLLRRHVAWDYSAANVERLAALGVPRPALVPIGYAPQLTRIQPAAVADIDVLFYGSMNERRQRVLEALVGGGARVEAVFGVYGRARDALIARAKLVLNVHFYEAKVFEIVRVSYLLANRRPVVSERGANVEDERPFEGGVAFARYQDLAATCLDLLGRSDERARLGEAGLAAIAARPIEALLAPAIAALPTGAHT